MPEGHEDSSPSDLSTERNPEKPLINLADLKNEIFIPLVQLYILASFAASPFSVLCHRRENWRNKERKKEATKKKESLPC